MDVDLDEAERSERVRRALLWAGVTGIAGGIALVLVLWFAYLVLSPLVGAVLHLLGTPAEGDGGGFAASVAPYPVAVVGLSLLVAWLWARSPGVRLRPAIIGITSGVAASLVVAGTLGLLS